MSRKLLTSEGMEECLDRCGRDRIGREIAQEMRLAVEVAMDFLDRTPVGEKLDLRGMCPSGYTYEHCGHWDGTEECRERLAKKAASRSSARLVLCED